MSLGAYRIVNKHLGTLDSCYLKKTCGEYLFESNSLVIEVIATNSHSGVPSFPKWFLATSHMILGKFNENNKVVSGMRSNTSGCAAVQRGVLRWLFHMLWVTWGVNYWSFFLLLLFSFETQAYFHLPFCITCAS